MFSIIIFIIIINRMPRSVNLKTPVPEVKAELESLKAMI